nr:molybdopterin dinucleotide binding domain-containing protein [Achromobacter sp. 2789STDY5608615]
MPNGAASGTETWCASSTAGASCWRGASISANFPPGVVRIQEGAWYGPTGPEIGALDTYGDPNTLTLDIGTSELAQAPSANTCLVEIELFQGAAPAVTAFGGPIEVDIGGKVLAGH